MTLIHEDAFLHVHRLREGDSEERLHRPANFAYRSATQGAGERYVAYALAPVGIDAPMGAAPDNFMEIASLFFTPADYAQLLQTAPLARPACFLQSWCMLEAEAKLAGRGLTERAGG